MKILIATGIYPPDVGGPAQYAKNLKETLEKKGHSLKVLTYRFERRLPSGLSHLFYFLKVLFVLPSVDFVIALDTMSVGFPSVSASKIFGKKIIIRTGGDFLWESYVERTGDLVLFKDFYNTRFDDFSFKEKLIFKLTKFTLQNSSYIVFSTEWQKGIFEKAYDLDSRESLIIENYYGEKALSDQFFSSKIFIGGTRLLKWKNKERLSKAFENARSVNPSISLDLDNLPYEKFLKKMESSYAVILVSLGDISPNMILDALRLNKPFILTKETGLYERLKDVGVFADPEDEEDIKEKILFLSDDANYKLYQDKIKSFLFTHSWEEIADEFLKVYGRI